MIEDTGLRVQNIADTYFPNQTARSRFLEEMQNNMKKYSGIPLYMSNEELSEERNEQNEKDYYEGTEKSLLSGDMSNPVDAEKLISNIDAYSALERSYPSTVVYAAFTDKEVAESMQTDDAFFINAANTDEDYPVWVTRTNIVNSALLDAMENDEASIFSQIKRVAVPTGLAIGFEAMKSTTGAFLASGLSAAYDVTRLGGQSIYNVQEKYKQRYMDIIGNKNLNQEQTLEAAKRMFEDLKAEVPEEYRYEIYKGIYERPDPFADFGQAFSGATLEAGWRTLKAGVRDSMGMFRGMKEYSKKSLNKVKNVGQPNQGIEELDMNDELIKKIEDHVNNKVSEETVDAVVEHKAAAKAPKTPEETTPEKEEVVKGIIKEKEIDNNLLLNNNGDHLSYEPTGWPISYGKMLHDLGKFGPGIGKSHIPLGEINESGKDLKEAVVIRHGIGVDGTQGTTLKEAMKLRKQLQSNAVTNVDKNYTSKELPDYVAFSSASVRPWGPDDEGIVRPYLSKETARTGAGGMSFHYGIYGSTVAGKELSRKHYLSNVHYQEAMHNAFKSFMKGDVIDKATEETLKHTDKMDFQAVLRSQKDLERVFMDPEGYDLSAYITQIKSKLKKAESDYDKTYYSEMLIGLKEMSKVDRKNIPVYLNTFTGKNPTKYPYKYIFDDENSEPYVLKITPEDFKEIPVENQNKYKEVDEKFNKWKRDIKDAVKEKYPEEFGGINSSETMSRDDWEVVLETYIKDVLNIKEDPEYWLRSELNKMGFSAWLHMHHDNAMNVVTINDKDFSAITSMETFRNNFLDLEQSLQDNGFGIVSEDGINFFVDEWHMPDRSKPVLIKNFKYVDKP